jgi:hypothetical protein
VVVRCGAASGGGVLTEPMASMLMGTGQRVAGVCQPIAYDRGSGQRCMYTLSGPTTIFFLQQLHKKPAVAEGWMAVRGGGMVESGKAAPS